MSLNSASSLVSDTTTDITSYDIPLQRRSGDLDLYNSLSHIETTSFTQDSSIHNGQSEGEGFSVNPIFDHGLEDESSPAFSHGFFLGKESLHNLSVPGVGEGSSSGIPEEEEEDDAEDEGISEIYRAKGDPSAWIRLSSRSFKNSPEPTPRHALSRRIGNIGVIGQNIALGHRLGVLTEDANLIPKKVKLNASHFVITEDSPVQTDITWTKSDNASNFSSLVYKIEMRLVDDRRNDIDLDLDREEVDTLEDWTPVAEVRWPICRIYHTDDKIFIGKGRVHRRKEDIKINIRVRCHGEIVLPDRTRHWTVSSYSQIAEVTFAGYDYDPAANIETQLTHL